MVSLTATLICTFLLIAGSDLGESKAIKKRFPDLHDMTEEELLALLYEYFMGGGEGEDHEECVCDVFHDLHDLAVEHEVEGELMKVGECLANELGVELPDIEAYCSEKADDWTDEEWGEFLDEMCDKITTGDESEMLVHVDKCMEGNEKIKGLLAHVQDEEHHALHLVMEHASEICAWEDEEDDE